MLLGYKLQNWDFKALFRGVVKTMPDFGQLNLAIQIDPVEEEGNILSVEDAQDYLERYFERAVYWVYWGKPKDFMDEKDFWLFDGSAGDVVTIAMQAQGDRLDPFLELVGPDGTLLIWDDDGGVNFNSRITGFVLPVSGSFAVVASGFGGTEGDYLLALRQGSLGE